MGYTYDFKNNEYYSAEDINSIRASFVTPGVIGGMAPAMAASILDGKVMVSEGLAVFKDGSSLKIDEDGVELEFEPGVINYVYLMNDTQLNKNTVNVSTDQPVGDYIMIAEIDETGNISDKRVLASARYAALAPQKCVVNLDISPDSDEWDNTKFIHLCTLDIDRNLTCVTVLNRYTFGSYQNITKFITGEGTEFNLYHSNNGDDVDILITPNFEIYARAKNNCSKTLIFEQAVEGIVEYV